jgi:hypothetical protein
MPADRSGQRAPRASPRRMVEGGGHPQKPLRPARAVRPRKFFCNFPAGARLWIVASGLWITRITRPARDGAYMAPQTSRFDA